MGQNHLVGTVCEDWHEVRKSQRCAKQNSHQREDKERKLGKGFGSRKAG